MTSNRKRKRRQQAGLQQMIESSERLGLYDHADAEVLQGPAVMQSPVVVALSHAIEATVPAERGFGKFRAQDDADALERQGAREDADLVPKLLETLRKLGTGEEHAVDVDIEDL